MLRKLLICFATGTVTVIVVDRAISLLNQPSNLAVVVGLAMLLTAGVVVFVAGEYVVKSLTETKVDDNVKNKDGGASI